MQCLKSYLKDLKSALLRNGMANKFLISKYQKINIMNNTTRREALEKCVNIDTNSKVGSTEIIVPIKTDDGIVKSVQQDGIIPGNYADYSLENLITLGVKLNETHLSGNTNELLKETVERYAQNYLESLNNNNNE